MDDLFLLLALLSLVAMVIGVINPKLIKMPNRKRALIVTTASLFLFFILFGATTDVEDNAQPVEVATDVEEENDDKEDFVEEQEERQQDDSNEDEEQESVEEVEPEEIDPQKELEKLIEDEITIAEVLSVNGVYEEPITMQVELKGKENLTQNLTVTSFKLAIVDAVYAVKGSGYDVGNLGVSLKYPLVDKYGNESDEYVIKSDFSGETINKLVDDKNKFNTDNLNIVADEWWEHPAISN